MGQQRRTHAGLEKKVFCARSVLLLLPHHHLWNTLLHALMKKILPKFTHNGWPLIAKQVCNVLKVTCYLLYVLCSFQCILRPAVSFFPHSNISVSNYQEHTCFHVTALTVLLQWSMHMYSLYYTVTYIWDYSVYFFSKHATFERS